MNLASHPAPVQPRYRPTIATQIAHHGPQLGYLAQFLTERQYSDASREKILDHAGDLSRVPDPSSPVWRALGDHARAAAVLAKGHVEARTRALWAARNADRLDAPLTPARAFHDAVLDSLL